MCRNIRSFLTGIFGIQEREAPTMRTFSEVGLRSACECALNHLHDQPCHCRHFAVREMQKQVRIFVAFGTFTLQTATLHDLKDPAMEYSSIPMRGKYAHKARLSKLVSNFGPSTESTLKWYRSKNLILINASDVIIHLEQKDLPYLKLPHTKPKDGTVPCIMIPGPGLKSEGGQLFDEILVFKSRVRCLMDGSSTF